MCTRVSSFDMRLKFEDVEVRVELAKLSFVGGTQAIKAKNRLNLDGAVFLEEIQTSGFNLLDKIQFQVAL